ncbi:MAG: ABC transporter substrate-binding protein [Elusimicrobia bacterium]|nr:ABC transporter substrate-binding protein [Elusimicrobiota bacterium]
MTTIGLALALWSGCASAAPTPRPMVYAPLWSPQAQFAGYYMAEAKGFYRKRGLDVTILQGGPDMPADALLRERKADFGTLWLSEAIRLRAHGVRLVNLAQTSQYSALVLVAMKSSGIGKPADMKGKKVGLWESFQILPRAFFKKYGVSVREVRQSHSVNLFLRGGVDLASAMIYNEYHTMLNSGLEPRELSVFRFDEYGLNSPEDGIYALEATYRKDPARACAFAMASLEGWDYAFSHQDEALEVVLQRMRAAHIPADLIHQRWMLDQMRELFQDRSSRVLTGRLKPEDYARTAQVLVDGGLIQAAPAFDSFLAPCAERDAR